AGACAGPAAAAAAGMCLSSSVLGRHGHADVLKMHVRGSHRVKGEETPEGAENEHDHEDVEPDLNVYQRSPPVDRGEPDACTAKAARLPCRRAAFLPQHISEVFRSS